MFTPSSPSRESTSDLARPCAWAEDPPRLLHERHATLLQWPRSSDLNAPLCDTSSQCWVMHPEKRLRQAGYVVAHAE